MANYKDMPDTQTQQIIEVLVAASSNAGGAAISAIHDYFFSKKTAIVSIAGFTIGLLCSIYLTDTISLHTKMDKGATGFIVGLLGKLIVTVALSVDLKSLVNAYIEKKLEVDMKKYKEKNTDNPDTIDDGSDNPDSSKS